MPRRQTVLLYVSAFLTCLFLYWPALHGALISDDLATLTAPELQSLGWDHVRAIFDPRSPVVPALVNYAPLHALFHAFEIALFGHDLFAMHLVNVALHALIAVQLAALFCRSGIPRNAAWLAALLFLVHPANVEAVAWISQLKTTSSTALALGALLAHRRRPALAAALFGCALLAKAQAAFALPVLALFELSRESGICGRAGRARWAWVGVWALLFAAFCAVEAPVLIGTGTVSRPDFEADRWLHARTMLAIFARYLAMALAGTGTSTLHEPAPVASLADPWWIAGTLAVLAIGARALWALRQRRSEAAWWCWAAVAYAPVSQALPFMYLISDRYLYTVLPGLLGGVLLAGHDLAASLRSDATRRALGRGTAIAAAALALFFAVRVRTDRAPVWRTAESYEIDAALHYPDGVTGQVLRARGCARRGDATCAVAALRAARARGWTWVGVLFTDPAFERVRSDPTFHGFVLEVTQQMLDAIVALPSPSQEQLQILAQVHIWRGNREAAIQALERAIEAGGPATPALRQSLAELKAGGASR